MNEQPTTQSAGMVFTGQGVTLYRWMTLRSAVKLESKGIKVLPRSARLQAARELGMAGKPSFAAVLSALDVRIAEVRAALKPGEVKTL